MPRQGRIDYPGALHHIIVRGIERRRIFNDEHDRSEFINRLSQKLIETATPCYAWALMPNHYHLLLLTGKETISRVMQAVLTGYAVYFNRRHKRCGHLFQNRYKSILCDRDEYFKELVRYIHLNPLRGGIVCNMSELKKYKWSGHYLLMNNNMSEWQCIDEVLGSFGSIAGEARKRYEEFIEDGIKQADSIDFEGGGLIRSIGGWKEVLWAKRRNERQLGDERILGDGDFVEAVLHSAEEEMLCHKTVDDRRINVGDVIKRAAEEAGIKAEEVYGNSKIPARIKARVLACVWLVDELEMMVINVSRLLKVSPPVVSRGVRRGRLLCTNEKIKL